MKAENITPSDFAPGPDHFAPLHSITVSRLKRLPPSFTIITLELNVDKCICKAFPYTPV